MDMVTFSGIVVALLARFTSGDASTPFQDRVCQQCNSWCLEQPHSTTRAPDSTVAPRVNYMGPRGPAGPKGEMGFPGLPGYDGEKGQKGDGCTCQTGHVNMGDIEALIDTKIQQALSGYQSSSTPTAASTTSGQMTYPYEPNDPPQDCSDVRRNSYVNQPHVSGALANVTIKGYGRVEVYCDFTIDGGDWIVFQRRQNGSVDFYRGWDDYVNGFGDKVGDFWLGLETLHQITQRKQWELRIDMVTTNDERYYVKYSRFRIASSRTNYKLRVVDGFSGNTTDSLHNEHWNRHFSTFDADHDEISDENCAEMWHGAWWYNRCGNLHSNLNGQFAKKGYDGMSWYRPKQGWMYLKFSEMKIRIRRL